MAEKLILKDAKGNRYTALKIPGRMIETTTPASKGRDYVPGRSSYSLMGGGPLNYDPESDTFTVAETGLILSRVLDRLK